MLFVRAQRGMYLPNPNMEIAVGDVWMNPYDMMHISELEKNEQKTRNQTIILKFIEETKNWVKPSI
jgi:hypothetical protein